MGIQDLQKLFEINQQIKQFDKKKYYNFIMDTDTKEGKTRIVIDEFGKWKKTPCLTEEQRTSNTISKKRIQTICTRFN